MATQNIKTRPSDHYCTRWEGTELLGTALCGGRHCCDLSCDRWNRIAHQLNAQWEDILDTRYEREQANYEREQATCREESWIAHVPSWDNIMFKDYYDASPDMD